MLGAVSRGLCGGCDGGVLDGGDGRIELFGETLRECRLVERNWRAESATFQERPSLRYTCKATQWKNGCRWSLAEGL